MVYAILTVGVVIASVLLIIIVLIQNSKGGGLSSNFSSSNQIMGVRKTTEVVEKVTWVLAGIVLVLSVFSTAFIPRETVGKSAIDGVQNNLTDPNLLAPGFDVSAPSEENAAPAEVPAQETTAAPTEESK